MGNICTARTKGKHEDIDDRNPGRAGYNCFGTRIQSTAWSRQKPVRAMETPPPVSERPKIEGALPKAPGPGRNPLQMLNPWAPARYGIWVVRTHRSILITPGKWNGIGALRDHFLISCRGVRRGERLSI